MFKIVRFSLLLLITFSLKAQVGGEGVYRFFNLATSPRQAALGGKIFTLYDYDVNQPLTNPSVINDEMDGKLGLNYGSHLAGVNYGAATFAYTHDRHLQTFHGGISYMNSGQFDGRDELGNTTGNFTVNEVALSVGYAYNIPWTELYLGANARLISSTLETYQSFGVSTDIAATYLERKKNLIYTVVLRNLGTQISAYNEFREKLPMEIVAGVSQKLEHIPLRWHLTLENLQKWNVAFSNPARSEQTIDGGVKEENVGFIANLSRHMIVGAEFFPDRAINLRLGYNFRRAAELSLLDQRTFAGFSAGFGIRLEKFRFDYSYARYNLASNASMFGLMINL